MKANKKLTTAPTPSPPTTRFKLSFPDSEIRLAIRSDRGVHIANYDIAPEILCLANNLFKLLNHFSNGYEYALDSGKASTQALPDFMPRAVRLFFEQLPYKISEAIFELKWEVIGQILLQIKDKDASLRTIPEDCLRKAVDISERKKKRRLNIARGGKRFAKHEWDDDTYVHFLESWTVLKPIWKHASSVYKRNRGEREWPKIVKASIGEYDLPSDLIERLGDSSLDRLNPADLALEHAARLCGCEEYLYDSRQLKRHLSKARKVTSRKLHDSDIQMMRLGVM